MASIITAFVDGWKRFRGTSAEHAADEAVHILDPQKAAAVRHLSSALSDLQVGRFNREDLDRRLTTLRGTADQLGSIDSNIVRDGGKFLSAKKAEEALLRGEKIHPREMAAIESAKVADFDKWEKITTEKAIKDKLRAEGKGGSSWWSRGIATAALSVGAVGTAVYFSDAGLSGLARMWNSTLSGKVTGAQTGAENKDNLNIIQNGGVFRQDPRAAQTSRAVTEKEFSDLVKENLEDYVAFANSKELDPQNIAPDLTENQKKSLFSAFATATRTATANTVKGNAPLIIDNSNVTTFVQQFKSAAEDALKQVDVPNKTKAQVMKTMVDDQLEDAVVTRLRRELKL